MPLVLYAFFILWRVVRVLCLTEENVMFAACFALKGHGTDINIPWFCSWSAGFALGCKSTRVKVLINMIRVYVSIIFSKVSSGSE